MRTWDLRKPLPTPASQSSIFTMLMSSQHPWSCGGFESGLLLRHHTCYSLTHLAILHFGSGATNGLQHLLRNTGATILAACLVQLHCPGSAASTAYQKVAVAMARNKAVTSNGPGEQPQNSTRQRRFSKDENPAGALREKASHR